MVDVSRIPGVQVEDEVCLVGEQEMAKVNFEDQANLIGAIPNALLTAVNPRVARIVKGQGVAYAKTASSAPGVTAA